MDEAEPAGDDDLEFDIPEMHHVQILVDGELYYEDRNVIGATVFHTRARCADDECEHGRESTQYVWALQAHTLTELDMGGEVVSDKIMMITDDDDDDSES